MLSGFQKKIFSIGRVLYLLLLAAALISAFLLFRGGVRGVPEAAAPAAILLVLLGSAVLVVMLRNLYWKTSSAEAFFIALTFVALTLEGLRLVILLAVARNVPLELRLVLTRLVYLGRIFGLSCLLLSSLYAVGLKATNLRFPVSIPLVLALVVAGLLPMDATRLAADYLYPLGDPHGYRFVEAALGILVVLDFAAAGFVRDDRRYLWAALAAAVLMGGRLLFQYGRSPLSIGSGAVLLLAGGGLFVRRLGSIYLWY